MRVQKGKKAELDGSGLGVRAQGQKKHRIIEDSRGKLGAGGQRKLGSGLIWDSSEAKEKLYKGTSQSTHHSFPKSRPIEVENLVPEEDFWKGPPFGGNQPES